MAIRLLSCSTIQIGAGDLSLMVGWLVFFFFLDSSKIHTDNNSSCRRPGRLEYHENTHAHEDNNAIAQKSGWASPASGTPDDLIRNLSCLNQLFSH